MFVRLKCLASMIPRPPTRWLPLRRHRFEEQLSLDVQSLPGATHNPITKFGTGLMPSKLAVFPTELLWVVFWLPFTQATAQSPVASRPPLLQIRTQAAEQLVGLPIHWSDFDAVLLESTGRMHHLSNSDIVSHKLLERPFQPQSNLEASRLLQQELGPNFEVLIQGPYVIGSPKSRAGRWRDRFQSLLAGYMRYFEVRGWPLRQPDFPLVVIVLPDRSSFQRYLAHEGIRLGSNVVGSYLPRSNRCVLYELDGAVGVDWSETEATIVHEAVHQIAFNTGVHERLAENPLWLVEGFATMFEQPAVYDTRVNHSTLESRMLLPKVQQLQPILREPGALESRLRSMIESDHIFQQEQLTSYAVGWALTFYLSERMPNEFAAYLKLQGKRDFGNYSSASRSRDFRKTFQMEPASLAQQIQRLLQK